MTSAFSNPFQSSRLTYRAIEPESAVDQALFLEIQHDTAGYEMSNFTPAVPQAKRDVDQIMKVLIEEELLAVVICLSPPQQQQRTNPAPASSSSSSGPSLAARPGNEPLSSSSSSSVNDLTPIGSIHLTNLKGALTVHRHTEIGVDILPQYQGQGYGSEAIRWSLQWAFETAGKHRVMVRAFEYNPGARRLYEKLGFRLEGRWREHIWFRGRFWDDFQFGMLEGEWRALKEQGKMG